MSIQRLFNNENKVIANKSVIDHNELANRDQYGCHTIQAIRKLPEKLTELKDKDLELTEKIDAASGELTNQLEAIKANTSAIQEVKENAQKIDIVENQEDGTFTFTNYNNESKTIQSGYQPDEDTLTLTEDDKLALKRVYVDAELIGTGAKDDALRLNLGFTITKDSLGTLNSTGLYINDDTVLTAEQVNNKLISLETKDTETDSEIEKIKLENNAQNNKIYNLETVTKGMGGYLNSYNFEKATPTQDELTNYALQEIGITDKTKIFNGTKVINEFDKNLWRLDNTPDTDPVVFTWENLGQIQETSIATLDLLGLVKGSTEKLKGAVDLTGEISINNLEEELADKASLTEENTFNGKNNFNAETNFNSAVNHDNDVVITDHVLKVLDTTANKDTVAQYAADEIVIEAQNNNNKYNLEFPKKSGVFATVGDIDSRVNLKYSKLTNVDTATQKEDTWATDNIDATLSMAHQNTLTRAEVLVSKNFAGLSTTELTESGGIVKNTANVSIGANTIILNATDQSNNKQELAINATSSTLNGKSIITSEGGIFENRPQVTVNGENVNVALVTDASSADPTTETTGVVSQFYLNTTSKKLWQCVATTTQYILNPINNETPAFHGEWNFISNNTNYVGMLWMAGELRYYKSLPLDTSTYDQVYTIEYNEANEVVINWTNEAYKTITTNEPIPDNDDLKNYLSQHSTQSTIYEWWSVGDETLTKQIQNNEVQIKTSNNGFRAGGAQIDDGYGVAIGNNSSAGSDSGVALGTGANAAFVDCYQIGSGWNTVSGTLQIKDDTIYDVNSHTAIFENIEQNGNNVYGILQGTSAPTEATVGNLSQVYFDTVNERYYICTKVETDKYTWKEIAVLEQITLSGESGTLTDYEYNLLTSYETTKIVRSGVEFKRQSKPINGSGKYVYTSTYYSEANGNTSEEYATYIILIDPTDKSWKFVLKNNPSTVTNAVLYSAQTLTQEQKDQACANIGINNKNYIEITGVPETATEGTITDAQLATLQASNTSYILFNNEKYDLQDIQTAKGYLIFTHKGEDSTDNMFTKCISVTISTKAWKLKIQGTDSALTENSTNLITSGAVYAANELKANTNASNIDYASFAAKLNIEQSFNLNTDGSKTIKFGNLLMQTKEMTIAANSSATFTFTTPFDAGHVLCWCNSAASAQSSNNTAAVTEYSTTSMTVRVTNADSVVTMFAIGWKENQ